MRSGIESETQRLQEAARIEEQKKADESLKALEAKLLLEFEARLAEERKRIEDAVRAEEQKKAEEIIRALRQRYEEELHSVKAQHNPDAISKSMPAVSVAPVAASLSVQMPDMSKLANGLSQQILNPLSGVINNIKLVKIKMLQGGDLKTKEMKEAMDIMEDSAFLCKSILTSVSMPSLALRKDAQQPVALNALVARIDALMGNEMKLQNISIQKVLQDNLPLVSGDSWLLMEAIFNLVSNAKWAIKRNPIGQAGTITITTRLSEHNDKVELLVADNGIGISNEDIGRIFEPFFTTKQDGLGLGLTLAMNIVKAHNGDIKVESKEGKGTTFMVTLPVANA